MRPVVCLLVFVASACAEKTATAPSVSMNQDFTLAPGGTATIQGTSLTLQFVRVSNDSRCPKDAVCVLGGDALVHVRLTDGGSADYELHTGDDSRASVTHGGVRIDLVILQPYPFSARTISPEEYRATFAARKP